MEAFYEGEEKGGDDRKEKGKEVKPWGGFFFVLTLTYCTLVLFEEITHYVLPNHLKVLQCERVDVEHRWTQWEK